MTRCFTFVRTAVLLLVCLLGLARRADAQQVAVKTNVLSLAALTPDLGVEVVTGEHSSVSLGAFGHIRPYGLSSRLAVIQPEFRYWFNGRPLTREYVGIAGIGAAYDMNFSGRIYRGNALALGLSGGYVFNLGKRWGLDLSAGTGLLLFRQKQFREEDRYDDYFQGETSVPNASGYKIFPVKAAVTIIYILK